MLTDLHGHALSGATPAALDHYLGATADFACLVGNPLAGAQAALAAAPGFTMAHVLVAWLNLLGTEPAGLPAAADALAAARRGSANERERGHLAAIDHLVHGRWHAAGRVLEDLTVTHPRDLLGLQAGHQVDFFTGQSRMLRDRIARALPHWSAGLPGYHAVLGMHAFGLEETGLHAAAERAGRRAVELEPRDGWAWHAVAHVYEMQQRRREGVRWLRGGAGRWSDGSFFAGHNWWHLALFHLGLDELDEVLALLDARVLGPASPLVLDMIDASALLWRLHLRGIALGDRWQALADRWTAASAASHYAFNDLHAMIAFAGAGRADAMQALLDAQARALQQPGEDNLGFLRDVGADATRAIHAFAHGDHRDAVHRLRAVRPVAQRFGGSHAQRDLIDLTLIEAARRSGDTALAAALVNERTVLAGSLA